MFEDEVSFWLDGTLHQTWARVGQQPRVDTYVLRRTAHVFGTMSLDERPVFVYQFADVFNGRTFREFLKIVVRRSRGRKVFMVIDNAPCHHLPEEGEVWLRKISLGLSCFASLHIPPSSTRSKGSGRQRKR